MNSPFVGRSIRVAGLALAFLVSACGLPRVGPSTSEIEAPVDEGSLPFAIVEVSDEVARLTTRDERLAFSSAFLRSPT